MATRVVGVAEARSDLSELINRATYAGERIIIGSRGKPKAAIINLADLRKLEALESRPAEQTQDLAIYRLNIFEPGQGSAGQRDVLAEAAALRRRMSERRGNEPLPDAVDELKKLRQERSR
jgi:prevent-host-death family protein